ncbi:MAG: Asp-tRNA(Asn)/Glu-tRNA(Gln) amidotransferase subunit GatC [Gammaproteobacteria bacterium]|nr:Asp-tRNA(Asn)/Glu-tRNA(Gln) amidotransferase subunit GatC [Gammaproteobacteria bacterium]MDE1888441.1 Asp-tRNA(Asn)/Glu-tRNA(Gln) amidotransferase subunit GatC [Gammaproteobacteria bacterium]MDE2024629.1 Asp-tRNA(Asn)/Glu-tRNA(Gln) amidotransferase subunit GatC [Gammaproteobacteria bacterium]MDE2070557.1 Asp-tRNA(Asn)/Glu-tRNA(Gln) amidotransferase subunit GatC [Gammaproteobacteria bacterium]
MALTPAEVRTIARLARLAIGEQDIPHYARNLSRILEFVAQLDRADTRDIAPMAHPLDMAQRLREDVVTETDQRDVFQQNAPQVQAGLYIVPKIIE